MSKPLFRALTVATLAIMLASCATDYVPTTATPVVDVTPAQILAAVNQVRAQNGSHPLTLSTSLTTMARHQAVAMAQHGEMSHDFGPGEDLRTRATEAGYHGPVGENVAAGQTTLEETISDWMKSPGHRSTLLSNDWTTFGMVVQTAKPGGKYAVYWAADFGTS
jgi:uncharacterized protein YkwD